MGFTGIRLVSDFLTGDLPEALPVRMKTSKTGAVYYVVDCGDEGVMRKTLARVKSLQQRGELPKNVVVRESLFNRGQRDMQSNRSNNFVMGANGAATARGIDGSWKNIGRRWNAPGPPPWSLPSLPWWMNQRWPGKPFGQFG